MEKMTTKWISAAGKRKQPGVEAGKGKVTFTCYSPWEVPVLILYRKGEEEPLVSIPFPETPVSDDLYSLSVQLNSLAAYEYNYQIGDRIVTDPCAPGIAGRDLFKGQHTGDPDHAVRGRLNGLSPYRWHDDTNPSIPDGKVIAYQLHVRGFTMESHSAVKHKGTFRGIIEKIPYLTSLGINQLILLPCYDFDEVVRQNHVGRPPVMADAPHSNAAEDVRINYWGFIPGYYFAPKASYASVPERACTEMKDMIRACHQAGIEVILTFSFGNDIDMDFIIRCLTYWVREYHVDGFSVIARDGVTQELARLPLFTDRKLISSWFSEDACGARKNLKSRMLVETNDGFMNDARRALRGEDGSLGAFLEKTRKNPADHAVMNYITHHDGFTLEDLVSYDHKHNEANGQNGRDGSDFNYSWNCGEEGPATQKKVRELRERQKKNALLELLLAQGTPMLLSGDELANSQDGNNNPYCHDNTVTWLDWGKRRKERSFTEFVKKAVAFRQSHGVFQRSGPLYCSDRRACGYPDLSVHGDNAWYQNLEPWAHHIGLLYAQEYVEEKGLLYVAYNFHWEPHEFALPHAAQGEKWSVRIDTSRKNSFISKEEQNAYEFDKTIQVPARTILVLETEGEPDNA